MTELTPRQGSILKFIEWRWGLAPLTSRDAMAWGLLAAFDFGGQTGG